MKDHLFRGYTPQNNEKERLTAMSKMKLVKQSGVVCSDYVEDLMSVIECDGLSGFELRYINKLAPKDYAKLPNEIEQSYINRIVGTINSVDDGEEMLILSEELQ